jgi:hypothetical protein
MMANESVRGLPRPALRNPNTWGVVAGFDSKEMIAENLSTRDEAVVVCASMGGFLNGERLNITYRPDDDVLRKWEDDERYMATFSIQSANGFVALFNPNDQHDMALRNGILKTGQEPE